LSWLCMAHSFPIVNQPNWDTNCRVDTRFSTLSLPKGMLPSSAFPLWSGTQGTPFSGCNRTQRPICITAEPPQLGPCSSLSPHPVLAHLIAQGTMTLSIDPAVVRAVGAASAGPGWWPIRAPAPSPCYCPVPFPTPAISPAPPVTPYCAEPLDKTLQPFASRLGSLCPFHVLS
jgi:hypothetical protein